MEYAIRVLFLPVKLKCSWTAVVRIGERIEFSYVAVERIRRVGNVGQRDLYGVGTKEEKAAD